jgi:hypothetical protein
MPNGACRVEVWIDSIEDHVASHYASKRLIQETINVVGDGDFTSFLELP